MYSIQFNIQDPSNTAISSRTGAQLSFLGVKFSHFGRFLVVTQAILTSRCRLPLRPCLIRLITQSRTVDLGTALSGPDY